MQHIEKFLRKLTKNERIKIEKTIRDILVGHIEGLNVKRMKHEGFVFRVRVGRVRIIYKIIESGVVIVKVGWRDDNTYKNY